MRVAVFQPQAWDARNQAVDAGAPFTFEVTTALARLAATDPDRAAALQDAIGWQPELEEWYEAAVDSGQIPTRWDGPSHIYLSPVDEPRCDYPEPGEGACAITRITLAVAHTPGEHIPARTLDDVRALLTDPATARRTALQDTTTTVLAGEQARKVLTGRGLDR